jgi:hypothetical protein
MMVCVPVVTPVSVHWAVEAESLPLGVSVTYWQPEMTVPLSVNVTTPFGPPCELVIVAVYVTVEPGVAGFAEELSVVVVGICPSSTSVSEDDGASP